MTKVEDWKVVCVSEVRHHRPDYPYRVALEDRGKELVIKHQGKGIIGKEWTTTHCIGITRKDLSKMLEAIKK